MNLTQAQVQNFIRILAAPRSQPGAGVGRFSKLHTLIAQREQHFWNQPEADQTLPEPFGNVEAYQSDLLRQVWEGAKSRLTENAFRVRMVPPKDTPNLQKKADDYERAFNRGLDLLQERSGANWQGDMSDGQLIYCYGILHWRKASEMWPDMPDAGTSSEAKEGYRPTRTGDNTDSDYIETDTALQTRDRKAKADSGFPWYVESPHPGTFSFIADRSAASGMAVCLLLREVSIVEYATQLATQDKLYLSLNDQNKSLQIYQEQDRPSSWDPSGQSNTGWDKRIQIAELWTRDEFYELCSYDSTLGTNMTIVKSATHPYGMPPFALAYANRVNHPDPALAHGPVLEGLYRLKPFHDRDMTLGRAIAEQIALPFYYIKLTDGSYMMDEEGKRITFSRNALAAEALPPGAEIVAISPELNPAVVQFLQLTKSEFEDAKPGLGDVEVAASTQPWTIRLAQAQGNVPIKRLKDAQAWALRTMIRNMQHVMSLPADKGGFGQGVPIAMSNGEVITLDTEDIKQYTVEVDINPTSAAERIANIEHSRQLVDDPLIPYPIQKFVEHDLEADDVEGWIEQWQAEQWFQNYVVPGFMRQKVAERFGTQFVLSPDGQAVDGQGMMAPPEQVLGAQGYKVSPAGVGGAPPPSVNGATQPLMPGLPTLNPPAAPALPGLPS